MFFDKVIVLAQLRHMPAAKRSYEAAVEYQKDEFLSFKIAQLYRVSGSIN